MARLKRLVDDAAAPAFQVTGNARVYFDFVDRFDPPDKVFGFGDRLVLGLHCADWNHRRHLLLRRRRSNEDTNQKNTDYRASHRLDDVFKSRCISDYSHTDGLFLMGRSNEQPLSSPNIKKGQSRKKWCNRGDFPHSDRNHDSTYPPYGKAERTYRNEQEVWQQALLAIASPIEGSIKSFGSACLFWFLWSGIKMCFVSAYDSNQSRNNLVANLDLIDHSRIDDTSAYFDPFGPVKAIDDALLSIPVTVPVIVLSSDAVAQVAILARGGGARGRIDRGLARRLQSR